MKGIKGMSMKIGVSNLKTENWVLFLLVLGTIANLSILLFVSDSDFKIWISDLLFVILNATAVIALLYASIKLNPVAHTISRAWLFIVLAQISFLLGDLLWMIYEAVLHIEPYPSLADLFYILYYPLVLGGIFLLPRHKQNRFAQIRRVLDALIVLLTSSLMLWIYLIDPLVSDLAQETTLVKFLTIAYPAGDIVLLAALIILIYNYPEEQSCSPFIFLILSMVVQIGTDILFSIQSLSESYTSGDWLDIGWVFGYFFIGLAGVVQTKMCGSSLKVDSDKTFPFFRRWHFSDFMNKLSIGMPYFSVVLAYILLVVYESNPTSTNHFTHVLVVGVVIMLVMVRQHLVLLENDKLNQELLAALADVREKSSSLEDTNGILKQEIDHRKQVERQLSFDALHDALTKLPNRTLFLDRLTHAIDFSKRNTDFAFAVLFLDLDQFKSVNDSLGHTIGDELLIQFASRIKECLRKSDTFARMGGDEFAILLEDQNAKIESVDVSNRVQKMLLDPFTILGQDFYMTVSIGIVNEKIRDYENAESILRDADIAMYHAKDLGKAQYQIFNTPLRTEMLSKIKLENQIRTSLNEKRFTLHYQPIYSIIDDHLVGFEALVRWDHPQYGLLYPADFLAIAENSGLILELGEWVLYEACHQMKQWIEQYPLVRSLSISVNLSGRQLNQTNLVRTLKNTLKKTALPAKNLHLEITETALIENQAHAAKLFDDLHAMGIELQIDDFGSGYSSIGYLRHFPVDTIKIDKCFVQDLGSDYKGTQIVLSMIKIANDLGMKIIAEGIETKVQLDQLKTLSCQYGQGYLLSKPLPPQDIAELLV